MRVARRVEPLPEEMASITPFELPDSECPKYVEFLRTALEHALDQLAPRDRLRLGLYYAQQLTLAEAGRVLKEHEATVSRNLARTRHAVRDEVEKKLHGRRILLVDEVDDSRVTLEYCLRELLRHGPTEIAVAVLHNKRKEKRGALPPEIHRYWAGEELEDRWICYPWDARDIGRHERLSRGEK